VMELFTRDGQCKLVERCSYPLTGIGCVTVVYTDYAVFDLGEGGATVRETFGDTSLEQLRELTGLPLRAAS
jgi:3-oxoadipate CoA-transferase, beta subunit